VMRRFVSAPDAERVVAEGKTKSAIVLKSGIQVDLRIVADSEFPFALHYFTGSKEHNVHMRKIAKRRALKLNEYGLFRESNGKPVACADESDIFEKLGLQYIPAEMREDTGEIEAAAKKLLPELIEEHDLRGAFHCHTTYSDGTNTLREMADAARERRWEYLGIADHSVSARYARGLSTADIRKQRKEIETLNGEFDGDFRLFHGIESDILGDGSLDYDEPTLASFDYVVASVHSRFRMSGAEMTARIVKAVKNKHTTILGHPTGRLLLSRDAYEVDLKQVIAAAADHNTAIEINSHPYRLDLDWRMVRYAVENGVTLCINPDAHAAEGLGDVRFGIGIARKGWAGPGDVLNTRPAGEVERFFRNGR
jgi:DNA polymerase (family X)